MNPSAPIGILGGTFDPVHNGHLHLARTCIDALNLAQVRLVPACRPPHRASPVASPAQRFAMLQRAVDGLEAIAVDDIELARGGISYTIDTVTALRRASGDKPLGLIMGIDAFQSLHTWRRWTTLLDYVHIIVAQRPGNESIIHHPDIQKLCRRAAVGDAAALRRTPSGAVLITAIPMLDISSTRIRSILAAGDDVSGLLPPAVLDFIADEGLYTSAA